MSQIQRIQDQVAAKEARHTPSVGTEITVQLPDERTRAKVIRIISANRIIVQLSHFTTASKSHNYKKDDFVAAEYKRDIMGLRGWHEIPQSKLNASDEEAEPEAPAPIREMVMGDIMPPLARKKR